MPPAGRQGNRIYGKVEAARRQLNEACWTQIRFDIGVLELDEPAAEPLSVPGRPVGSRPDEQIVMAGLPVPIDDLSPADLAAANRPERCMGLITPGSSTAGTFFYLEFASPLDDRNWSGSPILNEAGQVVGVYSRVTAAFEGDPAGPAIHAIVSTTLLQSLTADLMK